MMDAKSKLDALRRRIDGIDDRLAPLFAERMEISRKVAEVKGANNMAVVDEVREQRVVDHAAALVPEGLRGEMSLLMRSLLALSRERQRGLLFGGEEPLLPPPREPRRDSLTCAYQGVPGAWSEQALIKLFPDAKREAMEFFEDVFVAVREGRADYGAVPIENSKTGAIGETYDLLRKYGCFVVGRAWMDIRQCLLAPEGVGLADVREVFSHPEGFKQCGGFLRGRAWDLTACRNTAVAAQMAAAAQNGRTAAIGSRRAAELRGLSVLIPDIMDAADNRTSFVVIAGQPEYGPDSDLISVTFSTQHRSGALCETLLPFMASALNLMRIESRPAGPGKYRFFAELQGSVLDGRVISALRHVAATCEYFEVLGCYRDSD
jgi:chorismate mutase/prephenate dehydratase